MIEVTPEDFSNENVKEKRPFFHKLLLIITIAFFTSLVILAAILYPASPGPDTQEILGVGIGQWENESGIAFLSGRRLNCQRVDNNSAYAALCRVEIAGKMLEIQAKRNQPPNMMQFGGQCTAFYDDQEWPCRISSRHMHVHWFAIVESPLGLSNAEMDVLRQKYFLENAPEEPFLWGMVIVAVITAVLVLANFFVWLKPKVKRPWLLLIPAVSIGLITFYGMLFIGLFATNGFWD